MKVSFVLVFLVGVSACVAQVEYEPISGELLHYWYTADPLSFLDVEHYDSNLLPEGISELKITGIEENGDFTIYLIGIRNGKGVPVLLAAGLYTEDHNMAKSYAFFEKGEIHLWFQMPFCAFYTEGSFVWDMNNRALVSTGYELGDPSDDALELAVSYMDEGNITGAIEELDSMFYPYHYFLPDEMTARLLRAANTAALEESQDGNYRAAVDALQSLSGFANGTQDVQTSAENRSAYFRGQFSQYMEITEFAMILNNYAFFLEKAGSLDEALPILETVLYLDSSRTVAYLNIADVTWAEGRLAESGGYYESYRSLMTRSGLEDQIPERVLERAVTQ